MYTRNVINEHTRELSRTTTAEKAKREREKERDKKRKQKMYNKERGEGNEDGLEKHEGEDLLWRAGEEGKEMMVEEGKRGEKGSRDGRSRERGDG